MLGWLYLNEANAVDILSERLVLESLLGSQSDRLLLGVRTS
jgi:hypothetical protein